MSDQTIKHTERMTGSGHTSHPDTLNRLVLVSHDTDGTHRSGLTMADLHLTGDFHAQDLTVELYVGDTGAIIGKNSNVPGEMTNYSQFLIDADGIDIQTGMLASTTDSTLISQASVSITKEGIARITGNKLVLDTQCSTPPPDVVSTGILGQVVITDDYLYIATSYSGIVVGKTNWVRIPLDWGNLTKTEIEGLINAKVDINSGSLNDPSLNGVVSLNGTELVATATELNYMSGVIAPIQDDLDKLQTTNINHSVAQSKMTSGLVVPGKRYRLVSNRTTFVGEFPTGDETDSFTGPDEVLILTGQDEHSFNPVVGSESYPKDVIYYEVRNTITSPDGLGGTVNAWPLGRIYRRIDPDLSIDMPFDFRAYKTRLWASTPAGTDYFDVDGRGSGNASALMPVFNPSAVAISDVKIEAEDHHAPVYFGGLITNKIHISSTGDGVVIAGRASDIHMNTCSRLICSGEVVGLELGPTSQLKVMGNITNVTTGAGIQFYEYYFQGDLTNSEIMAGYYNPAMISGITNNKMIGFPQDPIVSFPRIDKQDTDTLLDPNLYGRVSYRYQPASDITVNIEISNMLQGIPFSVYNGSGGGFTVSLQDNTDPTTNTIGGQQQYIIPDGGWAEFIKTSQGVLPVVAVSNEMPTYVGINPASGDDSAFIARRKVEGDGLFSHAFRDESTFESGPSDSAYASYDAIPVMKGSNPTYNHLACFQARPFYNGTGTLGAMWGHTAQAYGSGHIAAFNGFKMDDALTTGTLDMQIGFLCKPLANATANFCIYSYGTQASYHEGFFQFGGNIQAAGTIKSSGGGVGYGTGAGGTIAQGTSRATTVVLNKLCGTITMFSSAVAADGISTFTFTNSFIEAGDMVMIQHISATNGGAWNCSVVAGAGTAQVIVRNVSNASITEATPLRFTIIKGVIA